MRGSCENSKGAYTVEQGAAESVAGSHRVDRADMRVWDLSCPFSRCARAR